MKLKALASLCNEARCVYLFNEEDGTQWAGTGFALWRLPARNYKRRKGDETA